RSWRYVYRCESVCGCERTGEPAARRTSVGSSVAHRALAHRPARLPVPSTYSAHQLTPLSGGIRDGAHLRVTPPPPCPGSAAASDSTGYDGTPRSRRRREGGSMTETAYAAYVGIDWGTATHQVAVLDTQRAPLGERAVAHDGAALQTFTEWLTLLAGGEPARVAVALEVPRGAVVDTLLERGFHVFALNRKQLDRFRD